MSAALFQPETIARARFRRPLLSSCAIAAALIAGGHSAQVRAQAFQGNPTTVVSGSIIRSIGVNSETIVVDSPTAVVNWTPTDTAIGGGNINYLPAGNIATFTNGANNSNFVILNRILPTDPTRAVAFNGTVRSQIVTSGFPTATGGSVWFYSPGGIILGSTAQFDVGSLVLTANNLNDLDVSGNTLHFRGGTDSRSAITITSGAQINATQPGSYVALVAPRVTQGGTVNVNGSVAYVAAESADITINGGLFDITVQAGSAVNTGGETTLSHSGTTTGDGPLDATDPQLIYMVAVPKNDAITMLVTGSAGYRAAGSAGIENGAVILSAGQGIASFDNGIGNANVGLTGSLPGQDATIQISGGSFGSRVTAFATTDALADGGTGTLSFASALDLNAGRNARLTANAGQSVTILGSMAVRSYNRDNSGAVAAGQAAIRALGGGSITVDGGATAEASSIFSGAIAGSALLEANGSSVSFGGESFIRANGDGVAGGMASATLIDSDVQIATTAFGSTGLTISATGTGISGPTGGAGIGGSATILVNNSNLAIGSVSTPLELLLDASARGGNGSPGFGGPDGGAGGSATGGTTSFTMNGGTFDGSSVTLLSDAFAGNGGDAIETGYGVSGNGGNGGSAMGGTATFVLNGGTISAAGLNIGAAGFGGGAGSSDLAQGGLGGNGTGGNASATLTGGTLTLANNLHMAADGDGGRGGFSGALATGGAGGIGQGGTASLLAQGTVATIGDLRIRANGSGGDGELGGTFSESAPAGAARGGGANLRVEGGTVTLADLTVSSSAVGGSSVFGASSGEARGGTATAGVGGPGILAVSSSATIDASASIDSLEDVEGSPSSGDVFGGTASFRVENDGTLDYTTTGALQILADASAGGNLFSGAGGNATGGTASFVVDNAIFAPADPLASLILSATGNGGEGPVSSGSGTGGTARLLLNGSGLFDVTNVDLDVTGAGGASFETGYGTGGSGGSGIGGTAQIQANAGTIAVDALVVQAGGIGADGGDILTDPAPAGNGGSGTGGDISVATAGGTLNLIAAGLFAQGEGGTGGSHSTGNGGNGGAATGGSITFMAKDSAFDFSSGFAQMDVSATAGRGGSSSSDGIGGNGGNATAGTITLASSGIDGALGFNSNFIVANDAFGGDGGSGGSGAAGGAGGNGGSALGGIFEITTDLGSVTIVGPGNAGPTVTANAFGGDGGTGGDGSVTGGAGGNGGAGTGGLARINVNGGAVLLGVTNLTAEGSGGFAGSGGTGPTTAALPGVDGRGFGGTVSIIVRDNTLGGEVGSAGLADTSINVGGNDVGGRIEIYDFGTASGGGLNFASLTARSVGAPNSMNEIFDLFSGERRIDIAGDADIQLGSPASLRATANGGVDIGGTLNLLSGSFVQIEHDLQPPTPANTISAGDIVAASAQTFNADPDSRIHANGTIDVRSNFGAITLNHIGAGGDIFASAPNGVTINTVDAGGNVDLFSSGGAILVSTDLAAGGQVFATGTGVALHALGDLNINFAEATAGDVDVSSARVLDLDTAVATGSILLAAGKSSGGSFDLNGDVTITGSVSAPTLVQIDGGGDVTVTGAGRVRSDGGIEIRSGDDILIQSGALVGLGAAVPVGSGTLSGLRIGGPADTVSLDAGVLRFGAANPAGNGRSIIGIDGDIRGLSIDLTSEDVGIGSGAIIGDADTTSLVLSNSGTTRTFIGGADSTSGYSLANAEFSRLHSQQIGIFGAFTGTTSGPAEVVVGNLDILGSASSASGSNLVGPDASLLIESPFSMRIEGDVALTSAGANDRLGFNASNKLDVITPSASIVATAPGGAMAGTIAMNAISVFVGSDAAAADVASLSTTDEIDNRLGTNDGPVNNDGYLRANALEFNLFRSLYIQNSGSGLDPTARAGFTAGDGGVSINAGEGGSLAIVINGRQSGTGGIVAGADLIPLLRINGSAPPPTSGFDLRSTANGCLIVGMSCRFDMETPGPPVQDVIDEIVTPPGNEENEDGTAVVQALNIPMIQLVDIAGLGFAPLIDEPVTGAGNDDFWIEGPK